MNKLTTQVHFTITEDELKASAPETLEPLTDFFEEEIGTSETMLDLVEHQVRHSREWHYTGDACHLTLDGETAKIEHIHTGASITVTRTDLRTLLTDLRTVLNAD